MLPASGKFGLNRYVTSSGSLGTFDVVDTQTAKFVVNNAGPTNTFLIKGKIAGQVNYVPIDTLIGSVTKDIDITKFDYIEIECTSYASLSTYVQIDGSGFLTSLANSAMGDINVAVSLNPSDDGVYIGDKTTGIPLKVNNDGSINVNTLGSPTGTPNIQNITLASANTEYSVVLPTGTRRVLLKVRNYTSPLKFAWTAGQSGTNYIQLQRGCSYTEEFVELTTSLRTIYVQSTDSNIVIEVLTWL